MSDAFGRAMERRDCVRMVFEATDGRALRLRPPLGLACGLVDASDSTVVVQLDPRREHERAGRWTSTRVSVWLWPVWPFSAYQPEVLRAAGALAFVVLAALFIGAVPWVIPAGYMVMLEAVALVFGLGTPGWWELGWTLLAWGVAWVAWRLDQWWIGRPS
jgi:hypothetical protein